MLMVIKMDKLPSTVMMRSAPEWPRVFLLLARLMFGNGAAKQAIRGHAGQAPAGLRIHYQVHGTLSAGTNENLPMIHLF